ncbi:MAG: hypothetical protein EA394_06415 [Bacteroidia bacterium]|nr:MAG: hypothetical protein EA394_06415 [Bacteroidia bacterium]
MKLDIKKYLYDIKESIDSIENYLGEDRDFQTYISKLSPNPSVIFRMQKQGKSIFCAFRVF